MLCWIKIYFCCASSAHFCCLSRSTHIHTAGVGSCSPRRLSASLISSLFSLFMRILLFTFLFRSLYIYINEVRQPFSSSSASYPSSRSSQPRRLFPSAAPAEKTKKIQIIILRANITAKAHKRIRNERNASEKNKQHYHQNQQKIHLQVYIKSRKEHKNTPNTTGRVHATKGKTNKRINENKLQTTNMIVTKRRSPTPWSLRS